MRVPDKIKIGKRRTPPRFDPATLRDLAGDAVYARGESYHRSGQVELLSDDGRRVRARVAGTELYRVELRGRGREIAGECSCPAFTDHGFCKHLVATALAANAAAATGEVVPDRLGAIRAHLRAQGVDRLVELILGLAERDPALFDRLDLAASAAVGDPAELGARCRAALKRALRAPGGFVDYAEAGGWTQGVLDVLDQVEALIGAGQAPLVLELLEEFFPRLAGALENVDDSDGGGSEILERAAALHLAACEAARPDPLALARDLFRLETTEAFGTFAGASDTYGHLLGEAGLAEYRRLAEAAWDRLPGTRQRRGGVVTEAEDGLARYRLLPILDRFAERDCDLDRRIALREALGLAHAHDYLRLAEFCLEHGRAAEALRRAEEGAWLFDDVSGEPLARFLKALPRRLGNQIKLLGLWNAPSSLIGPTEAGDCSQILDDLAQVFALRRLLLMRRIAAGVNVDRIYIRQFVLELQAKHDKIGHAAFQNVVGAVKQVTTTGTFDVLCKPAGQIANNTVLVASGAETTAVRAERTALHDALSGLGEWRRLLEEWGRSPGLVFQIDTNIQDLLRDCLVGLSGRGIGSFRLEDFVSLVKGAAREIDTTEAARCLYVEEYDWEGGDDDDREPVPLDWPTFGIDEREELERRVDTVKPLIDGLRRDAKDIRRVFEELVEHARLYPEAPPLTRAEIRKKLGWKRQKVHNALNGLRKLIEDAGLAPPTPPGSTMH